jgi:peptidoglycan hydrolase-like protein with peptidoglycan-binding domain
VIGVLVHHGPVILSRTEPVSDEPEEETLQQGSSGESVRETQTQLNTHGASIGVDGSFGPQTHGAVTAFQEKVGLETNGVVGPITAAALAADPAELSEPEPEPEAEPETVTDEARVENLRAKFTSLPKADEQSEQGGFSSILSGLNLTDDDK